MRRNSATVGSGGALGAAGFGTLTADDCLFEANFAGDSGGGIFGLGTGSSTVKIFSTTFTNQTATTGAGAAILNTGEIEVDGVGFVSNLASEIGGGLSIASSGNATLRSTDFDGNIASGSGGGVRAVLVTGALDIENSHFRDNRAGVGGGALLVDEVNVAYMRFSSFEGNDAMPGGGRGGAILVAALAQNPTATTMRSTLSVLDSTLSENTADDGGAIAADEHTRRVSIVRSSISENVARGYSGGAVASAAGRLSISSSDFAQNLCLSGVGGGIYTTSRLPIEVDQTTFSDHIAGIAGGAGMVLLLIYTPLDITT